MKKVQKIFEEKGVYLFLRSRRMVKQYRKAKRFLLQGNGLQVKFKERNPKGLGIWSFRINKKYRALGTFDNEENLLVFEVGNIH